MGGGGGLRNAIFMGLGSWTTGNEAPVAFVLVGVARSQISQSKTWVRTVHDCNVLRGKTFHDSFKHIVK